MYYFSKAKKIKCLDCSKNFRGVTERKTKRYICSGYHNYRTCSRWKIDEDLLLELITQHHQIELIKSVSVTVSKEKSKEKTQIALESLLQRVDRVEASAKDKLLRISFIDGTSTVLKPNHHAYYAE